MSDYRRKYVYIDKVFQNRFLGVFIVLSVLASIANYLHYKYYLIPLVEKNIYKSHFNISNVNEILFSKLAEFNIALGIVTLILTLLFYTWIRLKIRSYFKKVYVSLFHRLGYLPSSNVEFHLPTLFQDTDRVLKSFFDHTDKKMEMENSFLQLTKGYIENPENHNLDELIKQGEQLKEF